MQFDASRPDLGGFLNSGTSLKSLALFGLGGVAILAGIGAIKTYGKKHSELKQEDLERKKKMQEFYSQLQQRQQQQGMGSLEPQGRGAPSSGEVPEIPIEKIKEYCAVASERIIFQDYELAIQYLSNIFDFAPDVYRFIIAKLIYSAFLKSGQANIAALHLEHYLQQTNSDEIKLKIYKKLIKNQLTSPSDFHSEVDFEPVLALARALNNSKAEHALLRNFLSFYFIFSK